MNKNTMTSMTTVMASEIENLKSDYDVATSKLGECALDSHRDWRNYNERFMQCKVLEGQISILNKMMNEMDNMQIDIPQLATM